MTTDTVHANEIKEVSSIKTPTNIEVSMEALEEAVAQYLVHHHGLDYDAISSCSFEAELNGVKSMMNSGVASVIVHNYVHPLDCGHLNEENDKDLYAVYKGKVAYLCVDCWATYTALVESQEFVHVDSFLKHTLSS